MGPVSAFFAAGRSGVARGRCFTFSGCLTFGFGFALGLCFTLGAGGRAGFGSRFDLGSSGRGKYPEG